MASSSRRAPLALIAGMPQTLWGLPAVLDLALGGLGAGFYVAAALADALGGASALGLAAWLGPLLVLAGFAAAAGEAGRPLRGVRALRRVATSWMSRELWLGGAFVAGAAADLAAPGRGLWVPAAATAAAFVLAQGAMLMRARAVTAWSVPIMPLVFAASAAVAGTALLLLAELLAGRGPGPGLLGVMLAVLALGLLVWLAFLSSSVDPAFVGATAPLRRGATAAELVVVGYAAPVVLLALAVAVPAWAPGATALAAALAIAGQGRARAALILAAGVRRPVTLATLTLPRRRS
jgi:anaerobic dimethyl sulfoxide reductase subunit C (anchor subunit)